MWAYTAETLTRNHWSPCDYSPLLTHLQSVIVNSLAVDTRHTSISVAHDVVHRNLIGCAAADRLEDVSQAIEANTGLVDTSRLGEFSEFSRQGG